LANELNSLTKEKQTLKKKIVKNEAAHKEELEKL